MNCPIHKNIQLIVVLDDQGDYDGEYCPECEKKHVKEENEI